MLTPEVIEVPFLSFPSPRGEGEERNVGTSITSFSSFSCLLFLWPKEPKKGQEKEYSLWLVEKELLGARGVKVESPLGDPWLPEVFLIYEPLEGS